MPGDEIFDSIRLRRDSVDFTQWPKLSCGDANQLDLDVSDLCLDGDRSLQFQGNGQIRTAGSLRILTDSPAATEKLTILPNGNVGIGNVAPTTKLEVSGTVKATTFQGDGSTLTGIVQKAGDTITGSLAVQNNLMVQGDLDLGDADSDEVRIRGTVRSTHSSGTLQIGNPMKVTGVVTANKFVGDGSGLTGLTGSTQWVNGASGSISYSGGNVGIGITPIAPLQIAGGNWNPDNTEGDLRLGDTTYKFKIGIAKGGGGAGDVRLRAQGGTNRLMLGGGAFDALFIQNNDVSIPSGRLSFGAQVRQMINLWNQDYGIGVQSGTTYFRSGANFCWFKGGSHSDARDNPGGGTRLMALNESGDLILSARTNPRGASLGSLCRALVDLGNQLSINHGNDFSNGIVLNNGQVSVVGSIVTAIQFRGTLVGAKVGYVVDQFINNLEETLEEGDVVVLGDNQTSLYYGDTNDVPIPEVDLTETIYDTRACGIVSQVYAGLPTDRDEESNEASNFKTFTPEEQAELDITKVKPGQIGTMVTLGTYAYCKVDADIAPIKIGDLLTTSPTKGHAQKVLDRPAAIGAIIAKALAPLDQGKGKIPVMVTLQ
ncbi:MAG: hypothetical protein RBJ76_02395 [Stenomitos frigidus ULC029]